ncbi:unnamed protein product [Onchocerca flexuosa]|uniref:Transmembrane protein n=1 Tax=Onchocerca flexuosa TaxID=387005 RepID=A0A183HCT0_9BILA|nr:unnamed protein product [Onchocerca flexuosa]
MRYHSVPPLLRRASLTVVETWSERRICRFAFILLLTLHTVIICGELLTRNTRKSAESQGRKRGRNSSD